MLRWLREHNCPWGEATCTDAARMGHLDVLKWAREHDCPWNPQECRLRGTREPGNASIYTTPPRAFI